MRKERMENLTTTGKIAEKRDRDQQRITFVKSDFVEVDARQFPERIRHEKEKDYYTKWKAGDDRSGNCVVMDTSTSKWESVDCRATVYPFMCAIYASASTGNQSKLNDSSQFDGASVTFAPDDNASVNKVMLYVLLPIFLMCYVSSCIAYCVYKLWLNCARKPLLEKIEALKYENEYSDKDPIIEAPASNIAGIHKNANMEAMIAKTKMLSDPPLRSRIAENNKNQPVAANSQVTTSGSTNPSSSASGNGSMTASSDEAGMKTSINEILMNKLKARAKAQEKNKNVF
ncbi:hypothetical protein HELRODRAFT_161039 [Helobdella robusta]|uniref:C-type lectin domain-containing protein n=1 Tax=Helobdella robusta TaxID=6412 RepID=T1ER18_HELRO|nr:hypothetical protein HELRODRAFT_161039 [Helobdella robusta]ESO01861.1 hypothetical protein HELRODRAFT_161039 [Helobdella robusta]